MSEPEMTCQAESTKHETVPYLALPVQAVQALLNYLSERPWKEVDQLIQLVQQRGVPVEVPKT